MRLIDEEFLRHLLYGIRKMKVSLSRRGFPVGRIGGGPIIIFLLLFGAFLVFTEGSVAAPFI